MQQLMKTLCALGMTAVIGATLASARTIDAKVLRQAHQHSLSRSKARMAALKKQKPAPNPISSAAASSSSVRYLPGGPNSDYVSCKVARDAGNCEITTCFVKSKGVNEPVARRCPEVWNGGKPVNK